MKKRAIGQAGWLWTGLASIVAFIYFFPVLFIILTAFRSRSDTLATPPKWLFTPTFENFYHIFYRSMSNSTEYVATGFHVYFFNSIYISGMSVLLALLIGTLAAYGFSRYPLRGNDTYLFIILTTRMLPPIIVIVPIFLIFRITGLAGTYTGIILMYTAFNLPFSIWMMKSFFDELNTENKILKAQIDGLNARIQTLEYQKDKSALTAPFDGVITQRFISNGEIITQSKASFRIIESANNEISVGIPSKVAGTLSLGQLMQIKIDDQNMQVKLIAIGHHIDTVNRTVQLRLKMLEKLDKNKSFNGQLIRISIEQQINKAGFWLPINAITDGVRGQWQIFIASASPDSKGSYQLQAATVNVLHANEHSVYVTGIAIKPHQIVTQGIHRYVAGQIVITSPTTIASTAGNY